MKEARGDLWQLAADHTVDAVCITTNGFRTARGECVMGGGCALQARQRWPELPARLGALLAEHGNRPFRLPVAGFHAPIVSFPTKPEFAADGKTPGFKADSDLDLILASARALVEMADKFGWQNVLLPRPGVGLGRLSWERVRPLLEPLLDERFTLVGFDWEEPAASS